MRKLPVLLIFFLFSLSACSNLDYYLHSATGHLEVVSKRQTISSLLNGKDTPAELQEQLTKIIQIRDFASVHLLLPNNGSYRSYVQLDRPYVVWSVVATPEFSLVPLRWNFPIAGKVSYRGYFNKDKAESFARSLAEENYDTIVVGVPAYSTLNWFSDPVLSTFSDWPTPSIAKLMFHELAHQKLYVPDDTAFNESFATSVAQIGVERWLQELDDPQMQSQYQQQEQRQQQFLTLLSDTRKELQALYRRQMPEKQMRDEKQQVFNGMKDNYQQLRKSWQDFSGYDGWFSQLNNARFASNDNYHRWVPAFLLAMKEEQGNIDRFYRRCKAIARLPEERRQLLLDRMTEQQVKSMAKGLDR